MKRFLVLLGLCLIPAMAGNLGSGSNTCPTSGNKQVSTTQTKAVWIIVLTGSANTGIVNVGGSAVTTSDGAYLNKGDSIMLPTQGNAAAYDLSKTYFACTVTTDTIQYVYGQ